MNSYINVLQDYIQLEITAQKQQIINDTLRLICAILRIILLPCVTNVASFSLLFILFFDLLNVYNSLKMQKGKSESVYRRRTDNTMAKRKKKQKDNQRSTKRTHKSKDRETRIPLKILQLEQDEHKYYFLKR